MINFAALPTDQPYYNNGYNDILNSMINSYKNYGAKKDMQKQQAMQQAMQYAQPFGDEQSLIQNQMKMLQGYRAPEMPQAPQEQKITAADYKAKKEADQAAALAKYMSGGNDSNNNSDQSQPMPTDGQSAPMPSVNSSTPYVKTVANPIIMDNQQVPQAVSSVNPNGQPATPQAQQQAPTTIPQQGNESPLPVAMQQNSPTQNQAPQNAPQIPSTGDPRLDALNKAWLNPATRLAVEDKFGKTGSIQTYPNPSTGEMIEKINMPFGGTKYNVMQVGKTPEQKAFETEIGKANAAQYEAAVNNVNQAQDINNSLDQIIALKDNPELKNVIGKFGAPTLATYFGTPEQKEVLGNIEANTGKIVLDMVNSMKGASSDRDVSFVNKMKPNTSDPIDVFFGKTSALKLTSELVAKRNEIKANLIQQGVSPVEASKIAQNKVPMDLIKNQVDDLIDPKVWIQKDGKQVQVPRSLATEEKMKIGGWEYVQ